MQAEHRTDLTTPAHAGSQEPTNGQPVTTGHQRGAQTDEHAIPVDLPRVGTGGALLIALVVLALLGGLFFLGWRPHRAKLAEARKEANEAVETKPVVDVTRPKLSNAALDLVLPADVQPDQTTAIFARTSGYLKALPKGIDIGARVTAGQLIAEIAAPEVDAQLEEAKATLEQANVTVGRATNEYNYNKATYDRFEGLSKTGGVTPQQLDDKRASLNIATSSLKAAQANVLAAQAAVKRLTELQGFQRVTAPFDGTITARNYDAGALISATNTAAGRELFRIDHTDVLRVHVNVPQGSATDVKVGQAAELFVRNYPGTSFPGAVARTAGAIDPATRTMKVEVDVRNADHRLVPGMYGQIRFTIERQRPAIVLPTSALVFGPQGMRVAIVDGEKVHFQAVTVGRDFGSEAEIASGIPADAWVVTNPGEHLADGVTVKVNTPAPERHAAATNAPQAASPQQPQQGATR